MKVTAETLNTDTTAERSWVSVLMELVKARLTALVLITTLVGFYMLPRCPM